MRKNLKALIVDNSPASLMRLQELWSDHADLVLYDVRQRGVLPSLANLAGCGAVLIRQGLFSSQMISHFLREIENEHLPVISAILLSESQSVDITGLLKFRGFHSFASLAWSDTDLKLKLLELIRMQRILSEKVQLERLSITDPITQITNHRFFQTQLRMELERSKRYQRPLSLLMIDVDHFKLLNDQYGHPEGDRLLAAIAGELLSCVRRTDSVSRYGGEEFAVIMPDTPLELAREVAERIRTDFALNPFAGPSGSQISVTVSIGVAVYPTHGTEAAEIIANADQALYQAKREGRNRTFVARDLSSSQLSFLT